MIATFRQRNFTLLWLAGFISQVGNWVLLAALPFYVYDVTGSALAASGLLVAYVLPGVVLSSAAGVFVDRWDRRRTLLLTTLLQAGVVSLLLLVREPGQIWIIYVASFLESCLRQFFSPAENALLPTLVDEGHLVAANSLNALNDNLGRLVGPALGGILLARFGYASVVAVDVASYLAAALLIGLLAVAREEEPAGSPPLSPLQFYHEWRAGLTYVRRRLTLRNVFMVVAIAQFADGIISAILVVYVQDVMGLGATEFGWLMTARGVGGIVGGLLGAQVGDRIAAKWLLTGTMGSIGILLAVIVNVPLLWVALPAIAVMGVTGLIWFGTVFAILQQGTPGDLRGRVFGAFGTTTTLVVLLGTLVAGAFTDLLGAVLVLNAAALIYFLAGVSAWPLLGSAAAGDAAAE